RNECTSDIQDDDQCSLLKPDRGNGTALLSTVAGPPGIKRVTLPAATSRAADWRASDSGRGYFGADSPRNRVDGYRVIRRLEVDRAAERRGLVGGLRATPPRLPPKYFYDDLGCALYGAICALPEYYPTRTEDAIFSAYRAEIARAIGVGGQFVDLGAGDCSKGERWLPFVAPKRYVAVDIAVGAIERALARLAPAFPRVEMLGVITDFTLGLDLRPDLVELP